MSAAIIVDNIYHTIGRKKMLKNISFSVSEGEVFSLYGSSGCGKTTLLKMISGLITPDSGHISVFGIAPGRFTRHNRPVATVWQSRALFPHLTVKENIMYGLRFTNDLVKDKDKKYTNIINLLKIDYLQNRHIKKLSGGEEQKVALARALVIEPRILLLDEPFTGIDRLYKEKLKEDLRELLQQVHCTFIFVSHDTDDIYSLSNRIAVIEDHCIMQIDTPQALYSFPRSKFIAESIGNYTVIPGYVTEVDAYQNKASVKTSAGTYAGVCDKTTTVKPGDKVSYAIRANACSINNDHSMSALAQLVGSEIKGNTCQLMLKLDNHFTVKLAINDADATLVNLVSSLPTTPLPLSWNEQDALILKQ